MNSVMSREKVWDDLLTLPEEAFLAVREFVLFQKSRNGLRGVAHDAIATRREKEAAFARLMKFRGTIDREIDVDREKCEALDEKHKRSL